jgi:hypothetical protein
MSSPFSPPLFGTSAEITLTELQQIAGGFKRQREPRQPLIQREPREPIIRTRKAPAADNEIQTIGRFRPLPFFDW